MTRHRDELRVILLEIIPPLLHQHSDSSPASANLTPSNFPSPSASLHAGLRPPRAQWGDPYRFLRLFTKSLRWPGKESPGHQKFLIAGSPGTFWHLHLQQLNKQQQWVRILSALTAGGTGRGLGWGPHFTSPELTNVNNGPDNSASYAL